MRPMRTRRFAACTIVAMTVVLAACTSSVATGHNEPTPSVLTTIAPPGGSKTTTTTTARAMPSTIPPSTTVAIRTTPPRPGARCSNSRVVLRPGIAVPGVYLASLQALSRTTTIGVTASEIYCSGGSGVGDVEPFPAWLVVSSDGGRTWRTMGSQLPRALSNGTTLAFSSRARGWLDASGTLGFTADQGRSWEIVELGGTVESLASEAGNVVALAVRSSGSTARVWRLSATGTQREPEPVLRPPPRSQGSLLAVLRSGEVFVYLQPFQPSATTPLHEISTRQPQWRTMKMPPCVHGLFTSLVATAGDTLATTCGLEDVGMMHEPKAFFLSVSGGRTWQRRSAALIPGSPDASGIPTLVMMAPAASSPTTYYMATSNEVSVSRNAGRTWTQLAIANGLFSTNWGA